MTPRSAGPTEVRRWVPVTDTTVYVRSSGDPEDWAGQYVSGPGLARVLSLPVVAGSLADLTGTGTVAVPAGSWRLGQTASMWLGDSTPVRLRVVAVLADQIDLEQTVLLPSALRAGHTSVPMASAELLGRLTARLWSLRQLSVAVTAGLQRGDDVATSAALVKDLGTIYQQDLPEIARVLAESDATTEEDMADFLDVAQYATMMAPSYTIQGGTTQVLRGIVARGLGLR